MSNIIFGMLASPDKHEDFIKDINSWKYEIEGTHAKGVQAPYVSEIKFYDIRIPDEIKDRFLTDFEYNHHQGRGVTESWKFKTIMFFYKMFLKVFTPFRAVEYKETEKKYTLGQWYYVIPVGELRRKSVPVRGAKAREVL